MRRDARVAACIPDPTDPYRTIQIRGRVVAMVEEGGLEHINALAMKYYGQTWDYKSDQVRVIYKILPEHVDGH
ncbi:MAG: hypothetical protein JXB85_16415 [Anaerolineales bacterium]|nr:hypothetical protein [Anaerolineales bacterium]